MHLRFSVKGIFSVKNPSHEKFSELNADFLQPPTPFLLASYNNKKKKSMKIIRNIRKKKEETPSKRKKGGKNAGESLQKYPHNSLVELPMNKMKFKHNYLNLMNVLWNF